MEDTQIQYYDELINGVRDGMSKRFYIKTTSMTLEITAEQAVTVLEEYIESRYQRLDEFGDDGCEHELWVEPNDRGKLVLILIQPTNHREKNYLKWIF